MSIVSIAAKVFQPQAEWLDKEEFLDVIYWGRQVGRSSSHIWRGNWSPRVKE